jgi:hypothetical protein
MTRFAWALAATWLLVTSDLRADNWPHWRGPDNNGVARHDKLPIIWSESKNLVWKLPLPGKAGSTPVIWGEHIFLTSSKNNDVVLLCIRTDGKLLCERPLARAVTFKKGEANEGLASPSTDGKHVYTLAYSGTVACHDFDGNEVWKFDARGRERPSLPARLPVAERDWGTRQGTVRRSCKLRSRGFLFHRPVEHRFQVPEHRATHLSHPSRPIILDSGRRSITMSRCLLRVSIRELPLRL